MGFCLLREWEWRVGKGALGIYIQETNRENFIYFPNFSAIFKEKIKSIPMLVYFSHITDRTAQQGLHIFTDCLSSVSL